jgi:plastocyanin
MANCVVQNNTTRHQVPVQKSGIKWTPSSFWKGTTTKTVLTETKIQYTIYCDPTHAATMRDRL